MHLLNRQFFILITIDSINCKALEIEIFFESGIKIESQNVFLKKVNHISNKKDLEFFIKDESWIKDYSIRYIPFSSQVFIYITNREPIFVLNNEFFVDEDLKFFPYDYSKIDIHSVYGPVTRLDNVKTLIIALIIAVLIRSLLFQPFYIPSSSMEPTLLIGDRIFVSKYTYGYSKHSFPFSPPILNKRIFYSEPKYGDLIVFKTPSDNRTDFIKRLIGLSGDEIQIKDGDLYINLSLIHI